MNAIFPIKYAHDFVVLCFVLIVLAGLSESMWCTYAYIKVALLTPGQPYDYPSVSEWKKSALLALCEGNSPITGEFPAQRPATRSFDVFSDLRLNKRLRKQSWCWRFGTPWCSLWRHCNILLVANHSQTQKSANRVQKSCNMLWHGDETTCHVDSFTVSSHSPNNRTVKESTGQVDLSH